MAVKYVLEFNESNGPTDTELIFDDRESAEQYIIDEDLNDCAVNCKVEFTNPGTDEDIKSVIRELQDVIDTTTDYIELSRKSINENNQGYEEVSDILKKMKKLSKGFMFAFYPSFTYNKEYDTNSDDHKHEVVTTDNSPQEGGSANDTQ